ncbi:hypothetical protein KDV42_23775, partial [Citrobacter freundii]|uniref:hypothetical protein n=2 Tax=Enterobacteriaceae TaxID=543 RepID=UPI00333B64FA
HTLFNAWLKYLYHQEWINYCVKQGILDEVTPLIGHLQKQDFKKNDNYFHDLSVIKPCGKPVEIRMFYADLNHNPVDKSGVKNQSLKLGQAKNTLRGYCQKWDDKDFSTSDLTSLFESLKLFIDFD